MFSPDQRPLLEADCEWVDLAAPDPARYPNFAQAQAHEGVLHAGQIIYIPRCWPHAVESLDDTVSITVSGCRRLGQPVIISWGQIV